MKRRMFSRRSSGSSSAQLSTASLAPMVDMLTILVVAVLRTWSTDSPVEIPEANFSLPLSAQEAPVNRGVTVDVGVEGLYVEGWRAGASEYWMESDDVLIREVYEALQTVGGNRVTIRAHRDAPWALVGKVLFTAQQAGFENVELVAVSRASL
ncbi:MAG: biopolymer transport protein ExbD [Myxococcota bacterium]|jgi:biopolymer transport protein ExbD